MSKLSRADLYPLEKYSEIRKEYRARVMEHKKHRQVRIGGHCALYFEDRLTMQYQIQEMLRIEKIFDAAGIQDELDAYNPLIPDGSNWKATFMIEYEDIEERRLALAQMVGIEDRVWVQVEGQARVYAIADEDMERDTADKTSSVHFLRFELEPGMVEAVRQGAGIGVGIDHPACQQSIASLPQPIRDSLAADLV